MKTAAHGVEHYENFPVASWLTPARIRPAIVAIYWFARVADDLADEGAATAEQRLADLAGFRRDLLSCYENGAISQRWSVVFDPLKAAIQTHQLPINLLDDLLKAFEQDVRYTAAARWYASHEELLAYCRLSANPVGRLLLHLYGVSDPQALAMSDSICTSLQLINFWQDPSRDLPRERIYFPLDRMAQHAVSETQIVAQKDQLNTMNLVAALAVSAGVFMQNGINLPAFIRSRVPGLDGWRLSLELRCVIQGGLRILEKIEALENRTLSMRPRLNAWDACVILWRALTSSETLH